MSHASSYLFQVVQLASRLYADVDVIERMAMAIVECRTLGGRVFLAGIGGSAANASHAAADFRKLCGVRAVSLSESVAEITARINDEGAGNAFVDAMMVHQPKAVDVLFVLSVGGGTESVSAGIANVVNYAILRMMTVIGIVGPNGGKTAELGQLVLKIPAEGDRITPHTEAFQMVVLHALFCHPALQARPTVW